MRGGEPAANLIKLRLETGQDGRLGLGPDQTVHQFPILKNQHRGDTVDLKLRGGSRILIDVELGDPVFSV